ncbi:MAG: 4Fe-4S binding protein [Deltaproteobacteria bacterium]|nr:4Fe-4S binding protein [Deltaproteobacteria bacterium]
MSCRIFTSVDPDRCNGCGLCVEICPSDTLSMVDGKAVVTGKRSLSCGQCAAVCPVGAITVTSLEPTPHVFETFQGKADWLPWGKYDVAELARLMASRRSCRRYTDQPVAREILRDLVRIGVTAPSGTNSKRWRFTLVSSRRDVVVFGERIADFYRRLNRISEMTWLRHALKWCGKTELDVYHRHYHDRVADVLAEWRLSARDRLFHGAPAAIIVSCCPGASCPAEDALLATQNILLGAHALGLGTCLIGFAVEAVKRDARIKRLLDMPKEETVYSVIALGYPAIKYHALPGRKTPFVREPVLEVQDGSA